MDKVFDELFCQSYELRLLAGLVTDQKLERWIEGFTPAIIHHEHVQRYQKACAYAAGKTVLDLACGTGRGSRMLAEEGGARRVLACDIDPDAIRYARLRNAHPAVEFRLADATGFTSDEPVELAVCFETIEHVKEPQLVLRSFSRALLPTGLLIISSPIAADGGKAPPANPYHVQEWGIVEFERLLKAQFTIQKTFVQYHSMRSNGLLARVYRKLWPPPAPPRSPGDLWPKWAEWQASGLSMESAGSTWVGYQVLVCAPSVAARSENEG